MVTKQFLFLSDGGELVSKLAAVSTPSTLKKEPHSPESETTDRCVSTRSSALTSPSMLLMRTSSFRIRRAPWTLSSRFIPFSLANVSSKPFSASSNVCCCRKDKHSSSSPQWHKCYPWQIHAACSGEIATTSLLQMCRYTVGCLTLYHCGFCISLVSLWVVRMRQARSADTAPSRMACLGSHTA